MNNWLESVSVSFLMALLIFASASQAADVKERSFKVALVQVKEHPHTLGAEKFADIVSQKSGGKMKVKVFPGGTLGGDVAVISSLQGGTIEMTAVSPGLLTGNVKEFVLLDLPFLFNEYKKRMPCSTGRSERGFSISCRRKG